MLKICNHIEAAFVDFFNAIATKYKVDLSKVKNTCLQIKGLSKEKAALFNEAKQYVTLNSTAAYLKNICRSKGLKLTGKKEDLLQRINNPTAVENKSKSKKKSLFKGKDITQLIAKLKGPVSALAIRKNAEGVYVHLETNLVFSPLDTKVIGKWKDNQVKWLTKEDIQTCIDLKVPYNLPENLDIGITKVTDKKVIEELGEDDFKEEPIEESEDENEDEEF
jgi:hypothetical protein